MAASASQEKVGEVWNEFMVRLENAQVHRLGEWATGLAVKTSDRVKK